MVFSPDVGSWNLRERCESFHPGSTPRKRPSPTQKHGPHELDC